MPTTSPRMFTSGPPELPGLIAASVWIAGYVVLVPVPPSPTDTGTVQRADDAAGHGRLEAERRADGDDVLADVELAGLADRRGGQAGHVLGLDHREVGHRVGADDLGRRRGAVVEVHGDPAAALGDLDDVVVGEDLAVLAEDDAGAGAGALRAGDVDLHDRGQHGLGDLLDRAVGGRDVRAVGDGGLGGAVGTRRGRRLAGVVPDEVIQCGVPGGASQAAESSNDKGAREHCRGETLARPGTCRWAGSAQTPAARSDA